jgi:hypothetical protein
MSEIRRIRSASEPSGSHVGEHPLPLAHDELNEPAA